MIEVDNISQPKTHHPKRCHHNCNRELCDMKTFRRGQKVTVRVPGWGGEISGTYIEWDGICHRVLDEEGVDWNFKSSNIILAKSRRKYKQPPVWARHL